MAEGPWEGGGWFPPHDGRAAIPQRAEHPVGGGLEHPGSQEGAGVPAGPGEVGGGWRTCWGGRRREGVSEWKYAAHAQACPCAIGRGAGPGSEQGLLL